MTTTDFDALEVARELKAAGVPEAQPEAQAAALRTRAALARARRSYQWGAAQCQRARARYRRFTRRAGGGTGAAWRRGVTLTIARQPTLGPEGGSVTGRANGKPGRRPRGGSAEHRHRTRAGATNALHCTRRSTRR